MLGLDALDRLATVDKPVWVFDPNRQRHAWANEAALRFWHAASNEELLARDYTDMSEGARARLAVTMEAHRAGRSTRDLWTLYPEGRPTWTMLHTSGITLPSGQQGILFVAEPSQEHNPDMWRSAEALMHMPVLATVHRLDNGRGMMRNPAATLALGSIEGDGHLQALFVNPRLAQEVTDAARVGRSHRCEAQLNTRQGARWYIVETHPAWDPVTGARVVHLSALDISTLKQAQHDLEAARAQAEQASLAKTAFLAHMSHELRTPLNGVLGMLQIALATPLAPQLRSWLEVAQSSGKLLLTLLTDLLDLSRIEAGRMQIEPVPVDLHKLVDETIAPLAHEAAAKGVALRCSYADDLPPRLSCDPVRLRQVLFNVVGNAVKFTTRGHVDVRIELRDAAPGAPLLHFSVSDSGIGIASERLGHLFESFSHAHSGTARRFGGSGLGLMLVKRLVELMGGSVTIDSVPDRGTTVCWNVRCAAA
jgi:signal transduction histidine kinase